jgi:hypothetical protein
LDKGTQEKVDDYTPAKRREAVDKFLAGLRRKSVEITSYDRFPARFMPPKIDNIDNGKAGQIIIAESHPWLNPNDAENHFNFLVSIVTRVRDATDDAVQQAYDRLFFGIYAMSADIVYHENIWGTTEGDIAKMKDQLSKLDGKIDRRDTEITDTLDLLLAWKKEYQPTLDEAKGYFEDLARKMGKKPP